jgi:hypothetical protein
VEIQRVVAVTLTYVMFSFAAIIRIDVHERGIKLKMLLINTDLDKSIFRNLEEVTESVRIPESFVESEFGCEEGEIAI